MCTGESSVQTEGSRNNVALCSIPFTLCTLENHMDNMQNFELHSFTSEIIWTQAAVQPHDCVLAAVLPAVTSAVFPMQTEQRCKLSFSTSLHRLVQVPPFIGAKRVEGGHNKLPIKGAACQQPLGLFGVTGVGILHKHLVDTQRSCGWVYEWMTGWIHTPVHQRQLCCATSLHCSHISNVALWHSLVWTGVCGSFFWKCVY